MTSQNATPSGRATIFLLAAALAVFAAPSSTWAHGPTPTKVVELFHQALIEQDAEGALALLLESASIYEQGHAQSKSEYASHHLPSDMAFAAAVDREVVEQSKEIVGDVAWITTRSRTAGSYKDRAIDSEGVETIVLQHVKEGWRIAHIHWSSRKR